MRRVVLLLLRLVPVAGLLGSWAASRPHRLSQQASERLSKTELISPRTEPPRIQALMIPRSIAPLYDKQLLLAMPTAPVIPDLTQQLEWLGYNIMMVRTRCAVLRYESYLCLNLSITSVSGLRVARSSTMYDMRVRSSTAVMDRRHDMSRELVAIGTSSFAWVHTCIKHQQGKYVSAFLLRVSTYLHAPSSEAQVMPIALPARTNAAVCTAVHTCWSFRLYRYHHVKYFEMLASRVLYPVSV